MKQFVHLHLHTEYSLLDGACRIAQLAEAVKKAGQNAVAVTDHGAMYGTVAFYSEMVKKGVKPIIGCEVYVAPRSRFDKVHGIDSGLEHLVLLCENEAGYKNLIKLVSLSFIDGFYSKPRVDIELLSEYSKGLIALSGCLSGALCKRILQNDFDGALKEAKRYEEIFGRGNYFIEIQNHGINEQLIVLPQLVNISKMTGIPLVATNDVHYIRPDDQQMQKVLMCIKMNKTVYEESALEFSSDRFYLKTADEMSALFDSYGGAMENTVKIAERCDLSFAFGENKLPEYKIEGVRDNFDYLKKMSFEGLYEKYGGNPGQDTVDRLKYELDVINAMGYVDYYLVVWDFVSYARKKGITVGPGRGSGAGSLAAYCIGITGIDPIKYGLLFERFLNPERVSMPDFDIDFCYVRRQEVIDYVVEKYGSERVAQIITFGTMAARGAVRDVARAMDIPYARADEVAKLIPNTLHMTIDKALEQSPELKEMYENDQQIKELIDMSRKIEGMPRHGSTHASGVVITKEPVSDYVPLATNDEAVVTQFSMNDIAKLGLLKFDLLGLRTLTVIADAVKRIPSLNIEKIDTGDQAVYELFAKGQTEGIFQFESSGMKNMLMQLKPKNLEDVTAAESLYRPGPMKYIPEYIRNRQDPSAIRYRTPLLKPILDVTYGCLVYQEQVMQVFRDLAGYSYGRSDIVRRAMSKKNHAVMAQERNNFIYGYKNEDGSTGCAGAVKNGVDEQTAAQLFDEMMSFADYAYNKSHAASYALIAYQTAWLKKYYKKEFMAALLTSVLDNTPKVARYIAECRKLGIKITPPDVNISVEGFSIGGNSIVFGLLGVKNLGTAMIGNIIKERTLNGKYTSFYNFCKRIYSKDFNRRALESLIKCGALDSLGANRRQMLLSSNEIIDALEAEKRGNIEGQLGFFGLSEERGAQSSVILPDTEEFERDKLLEMEKETIGIYISGHPLSEYEKLIESLNVTRISDFYDTGDDENAYRDDSSVSIFCIINKIRLKSTKNDKSMAYVTVEDLFGSIEIIIFPKTLSQFSHMLKENNIIYLSGRLVVREDKESQIICQSIMDAEGAQRLADGYNNVRKEAAPVGSRSKYYGLHLLLRNEDCEETKRIMAMLSVFDGLFPVYIKYSESGRRVLLPRKMWVEPNEVLISELGRILGEEKVRFLN